MCNLCKKKKQWKIYPYITTWLVIRILYLNLYVVNFFIFILNYTCTYPQYFCINIVLSLYDRYCLGITVGFTMIFKTKKNRFKMDYSMRKIRGLD